MGIGSKRANKELEDIDDAGWNDVVWEAGRDSSCRLQVPLTASSWCSLVSSPWLIQK